jgi:hypothetical protein
MAHCSLRSATPLRLLLGPGLLAAALASVPAAAQVQPPAPRDTVPATPPAAPAVAVPSDTVPADTAVAPRAATQADTVRGISPGGAFVRSLVLPGWGQSAVGSPGRGAVYFALETGSLWMVYKSHRKLAYARRQQAFLRETGEIEEDRQTGLVNSREQQLEDWITLSAFLLLFNAADAFVAAHLVDFDDRIGVVPGRDGGAELRVSLPVGRPR